jgi:glycosyltransferase involved in cell wall biosynthesis
MRFIFLTLGYHPDLTGGAYRYVREVAERLAARGHRVTVLCPNPRNDLPPRESRGGVDLCRFTNEPGTLLLNWLKENRHARRLAKGLELEWAGAALWVLCHAYLAPAISGRPRHIAYLFTGPWAAEFQFARQAVARSRLRRVGDLLIASALRQVERKALRKVARILTISEYYARQLPRWHRGALPAVRVISGGVNTQQFQPPPDRLRLRADLGLEHDQFLFLAVRRLDPRMGLLTLIDSFATLGAEFPQARLWLAGSGPQQAALQTCIDTHGLAGRVRLLGFVPEKDLARYYGAADCTLMPSLDLEGFGLATVESLACGTPVLGSRAGATAELLAPLSETLLFEPGSVDALTDQLRAVLRGQMKLPDREACVAYAQSGFSWGRVVAAFEQTARELTAVEPPPDSSKRAP